MIRELKSFFFSLSLSLSLSHFGLADDVRATVYFLHAVHLNRTLAFLKKRS